MTEDIATILQRLNLDPNRPTASPPNSGRNGDRSNKQGVCSRAEILALLQTHRAGTDDAAQKDACFFAIARSLLFEADERFITAGKTDAELKDIASRMQALRDQHDLDEDEDFWLDDPDTPQEYLDLYARWAERLQETEIAVMREFGEQAMADLYLNDRDEFDRRYDAGFCFFYENDPEFPTILGELRESREGGGPGLEL